MQRGSGSVSMVRFSGISRVTAMTQPEHAAWELLRPMDQEELDYIERNRAAWEKWAPGHIGAGHKAWQDEDLCWGIWGLPESELRLFDGLQEKEDAIELGSGTAAISAWLARQGVRPVALDFSSKQLQTADGFQREFGVWFPLVCANAEQVLFEDDSFDIAVSEYGASLWCDPQRWLPEARRLLRTNGQLIFFTNSSLLMACTPPDGGPPSDQLVRDYFDRYRIEFDDDGAVEFHLPHGHWVEMLRRNDFVLERLIEVRPPPGAKPRVGIVTADWARRWPSEEIWVARKTATAGASILEDLDPRP
jgi:SAM-dependent methyltransferase